MASSILCGVAACSLECEKETLSFIKAYSGVYWKYFVGVFFNVVITLLLQKLFH